MDKVEIKLYRHKVYKNIYLVRRWSLVGGSSDADFFIATDNLNTAIENTSHGDIEKEYTKFFYHFDTKHSELKARITLKKEMEFDGYKGTMTKELELPLDDFELIILKEE